MKRSVWESRIKDLYPAVPARITIALADAASSAAKRTSRGIAYGVPQHEVTLTQTLLLDIARCVPELHVTPFTQAEESQNGADWEWWIEGSRGWFGSRMQAKRLIGDSYSFDHLVAGDPARAQIRLLIDSAARVGIPARFALYNPDGPAGSFSAHGLIGCFPSRAEGVTVVDATEIFRRFGTKRVARTSVAQLALPWSCLAGCVCRCPLDGPLHPFPLDPEAFAAFADSYGLSEPTVDPAVTAAWNAYALRNVMRQTQRSRIDEPVGLTDDPPLGWFPGDPPTHVAAALNSPSRTLTVEDYADGDRRAVPPGFVVVQRLDPR